jgi:phosphoglycolate phosphatase-like HAD superfamily hydrolase
VACAQADGVRCIGITTGPHPAADLHGADVVIDAMSELQDVLAGWAAAA